MFRGFSRYTKTCILYHQRQSKHKHVDLIDTKEEAIAKFNLVSNKQQAMTQWKLYEGDPTKRQQDSK